MMTTAPMPASCMPQARRQLLMFAPPRVIRGGRILAVTADISILENAIASALQLPRAILFGHARIDAERPDVTDT